MAAGRRRELSRSRHNDRFVVFGPPSAMARQAVASLLDRLPDASPEAFRVWREEMGDVVNSLKQRPMTALGEAYAIEASPTELLFAVQTYYAQLVRLWLEANLPRQATAEEHDLGSAWFGPWRELGSLLRPEYLAWMSEAIRQIVATGDPLGDPLGSLYQTVFPRKFRHGLGEYYTPTWLVDHLLDQLGFDGQGEQRLLDPTSGSGIFLRRAITRLRDAWEGQLEANLLVGRIARQVVGFERNPLAVLTARANYLLALGDLLDTSDPFEPPVWRRDVILDRQADVATDRAARFDLVAGNPPWIAWDDLSAEDREATKPLWRRYGLFSLSASEARHGGAKKDLAMLVIHASIDRYLADGGRLGMVLPQTVFQSKAGDGFRYFRLGPDGPPLSVLRVDDMVEVKPFAGVANWTATLVLERGEPTTYPVPYFQWRPAETDDSKQVGGKSVSVRRCEASPIDPARPGSPWLVLPEGTPAGIQQGVGPSDYQAHLGANTGGANGVYWLELLEAEEGEAGVLVRNLHARGRRAVTSCQTVLERDLIYPMLRWGDVARYRVDVRSHLLLVQDVQTRRGIDPAVLAERYPRTLAYLAPFESLLRSRAAWRRYQDGSAFYSMYNVGPYTIAPIKVVWRRMDRQIRAAVVTSRASPLLGPRPIIPQETCVLVAVDSLEEAHYLCAVLNSELVDFLVTAHTVRRGKGFGTPGILDYLAIRRHDPTNPLHAELAEASRRAHELAASDEPVESVQRRIDRLTYQLRGHARIV